MAKIMLKICPPLDEVKRSLAKANINLTPAQIEFVKAHEGHRAVTVEQGRVHCRECQSRST